MNVLMLKTYKMINLMHKKGTFNLLLKVYTLGFWSPPPQKKRNIKRKQKTIKNPHSYFYQYFEHEFCHTLCKFKISRPNIKSFLDKAEHMFRLGISIGRITQGPNRCIYVEAKTRIKRHIVYIFKKLEAWSDFTIKLSRCRVLWLKVACGETQR